MTQHGDRRLKPSKNAGAMDVLPPSSQSTLRSVPPDARAGRHRFIDRRSMPGVDVEIAASMDLACLSVDRQFRIAYANESACAMLGIPRGDLQGRVLWERLPRAMDPPFGIAASHAMKERSPFEVEQFYPDLNKWLAIRATPSPTGLTIFLEEVKGGPARLARDADGVTVSVGTTEDPVVVTEGGGYDAALIRGLPEAEARFRTLAEQVPGIIYIWSIAADADHGTDLYVSPRIEDVLGYTPTEWMADPDHWLALVHPDDRDRLIAATRRCIEGATAFKLEYRLFHKDGRTVWIRDEAVVLETDLNGRTTLLQGVQLDITAEMVGAQTLKAVAEERTQLIQVLAHELFTPITAIQGSALTLSAIGDRLSPADLAQLADGVARGAKRLRRLVHNLATAARLDHEDATISRRTISIGEVLSFALQDFHLTAENSRLVVSIDEDLALCDTIADLSLVVQALKVVIENALDYSAEGPVDIVLRRTQAELLIDVSDRGPGVAAGLQDEIFLLFTQGDSSDTRDHDGLGVGLFLARRIMRLHGGDLDYEQRAGGGSTFTFRFPAAM